MIDTPIISDPSDRATRIREAVIEDLAYSEARLRERGVELEAERDSYREVAQQAIHALHHLTVERNRLRERLRVLLDELRALRSLDERAA